MSENLDSGAGRAEAGAERRQRRPLLLIVVGVLLAVWLIYMGIGAVGHFLT